MAGNFFIGPDSTVISLEKACRCVDVLVNAEKLTLFFDEYVLEQFELIALVTSVLLISF